MARLMRMHFVSVGVPAARFAPLTLDFRSSTGLGSLGDDTVLWLRNGGGKSSILNLLFSVIIPSRRDFLGETAEGRNQQFASYVKERDLSFIVAEWFTGKTKQEDLTGDRSRQKTWVTGQMLHWQGGSSRDDANLKRWFFAFRTGMGLELDSLPVQGLALPRVENPKAFREWFDAQRKAHPAAECYATENQTDWQATLRDTIQLDPDMFRLQLEMNRAEGGADRVMRFNTAGEFAQFVFRVAGDERPAGQLITKLGELRLRQGQRPARLLEQRFLRALTEPLHAVVEQVRGVALAGDFVRRAASDCACLARAMRARMEELAHAAEEALGEAGHAEAESREQTRIEKLCESAARWYRRELLKLAAAGAGEQVRVSEEARCRAEVAVQASEAARAWLILEKTRAKLEALREARRQAQLEREPLRERLCGAAAVFHASLQADISRLDALLSGTGLALVENQRSLEECRWNRKRHESDSGRVMEGIGTRREAVRRRDEAWGFIVQQRIAVEGESPEAARVRVAGLREVFSREVESISGRLTGDAVEVEQLGARAGELGKEGAVLAERLQQYRVKLREGLQEQERLRESPMWREIGGECPDVQEEEALESVDEALRRGRAELTRLAVDGQQDRRAHEYWDRTGLLPPTRDAEIALEWLKGRGVPAFAAGDYLAGQGLDRQTIEGLVAGDPARFGGIVVLTRELLEKVPEGGPPPGISSPVVVSLPSVEASNPMEERVVLSSSAAGMASREAAEESHRQIMDRLTRLEDLERGGRARNEALAEILRQLQSFHEKWVPGKLDELSRAVNALELDIQSRALEEERVRDRCESLGRQLEGARERLKEAEAAAEVARVQASRLEDFHREHEARLPAVRAELERLEGERVRLSTELESIDARMDALSREGEELRGTKAKINAEVQELRKEAAGIPREYLIVEASEHAALGQSRPTYQQLRRLYEENPAFERLSGEIVATEERESGEVSAFQEESNGLAEQEWRRFAEDPFPDVAMAGVREAHERAIGEVASAKEKKGVADRWLGEHVRQWGAVAPPLDVRRCQAEQDILRAERDALEEAQAASAAAARFRMQGESAKRREESSSTDRKRLATMLKRLGAPGQQEVPAEDIPRLASSCDEIELQVDRAEEAQRLTVSRHDEAKTALVLGIRALRRAADAPEFSELRDSLRSWVRADEGELVEEASRRQCDLVARVEALRAELESMEQDRRLVLQELEQFSRDSRALLGRIEKVSTIPAGLGEWSGQRFIEVRIPQVSLTSEECQARLLPLLDELVSESSLPRAEVLAVRAVESLGGGRRLDIQLIKPHALGSVQRYPIGELGSFSDGERLTASVLIYCTLARLRARNRGRLEDQTEAGALILDNPIGKCSHHGLLELQKRVARQLGVQLVYTTGIDDLGAIGTFARVIRLTNSSRSRETGDLHVKVAGDSLVQGAGLSFMEAPPA